jgi:EmrB/QacA subfamily drug resistance transporter
MARKWWTLVAVCTGVFMLLLDITIVNVALPDIQRAFHASLSELQWTIDAYALSLAAFLLTAGSLADLFGRRLLFAIGLTIFTAGSLACGVAGSAGLLVASRAFQGVGGAIMFSTSLALIAQAFQARDRGVAFAVLGATTGVSVAVGPVLGGLLTSGISWRWIFFVNIPLCLLTVFLLRRYHESLTRTKHAIDMAGAVTLTIGLTALLTALLEGGTVWAWNSVPSFVAFGVAVVALPVFVLAERRAAEPVLPLWVLSRRLLLTTALVSAGVGAVTIGLTSYVPTFLEKVVPTTPLVSGLALAALTVGWPIASTNAGRLYLRIGFRSTALIGCAVAALGAIALALTAPLASIGLMAVTCFLVGLGLGLVATPTLIAAQSSVGWEQRGVVTGASLFLRSIGSALGVAVFGAIANAVLGGWRGSAVSGTSSASSAVFDAVVVAGLLTLVAAIAMPAGRAPSSVASGVAAEPA